jgi:hypothetical protein
VFWCANASLVSLLPPSLSRRAPRCTRWRCVLPLLPLLTSRVHLHTPRLQLSPVQRGVQLTLAAAPLALHASPVALAEERSPHLRAQHAHSHRVLAHTRARARACGADVPRLAS